MVIKVKQIAGTLGTYEWQFKQGNKLLLISRNLFQMKRIKSMLQYLGHTVLEVKDKE